MKKEDIEHLEWIYGRMIHQLDVNANYDYMLRFKKIINNAYESVVIGEQPVKENNWINLGIDNLPEFIKKDVDVQKLIDGNWVTRIKSLKSSITYDIAEPTISSKYRYRIQDKRPTQITREDYKIINDSMVHLARIIQYRKFNDDSHMLVINKTIEDLAKLLHRIIIID